MNVVMMTNTYLPHVGGVARSVETAAGALRARGHRVLIVAPELDEAPEDEVDVIRLAAIQRFNGSDFAVRLPLPGLITKRLESLAPDLVHSHHPFLMGDTALRVSARLRIPVVFTHHTLYERFTHYVPGDSPALKRFAVRLGTDYANLCDHVVAPSESIARLLRERGVTTPMTPIPTGIDPERFGTGDRSRSRRRLGLSDESFVVGHVGRLAPEKNLSFLASAVTRFLRERPDGVFLIAGDGPAREDVRRIFAEAKLSDRLRTVGVLTGSELVDAYHAMDVFAFASLCETQGMVLAEAMTAGVPVVAIDAPGVREIVADGINGRLLRREDEADFAGTLAMIALADEDARRELSRGARRTAEEFSIERCTDRLESVYRRAVQEHGGAASERDAWHRLLDRIEREWQLWSARGEAAIDSLREKS